MKEINEIILLYSDNNPTLIEEIDSSRGETDKRYVLLVSFEDGQSIAIKVTKNSFTSVERILGWYRICEQYNKIGIYCPQILKSKQGKISELIYINEEEFIVYAEEVKKYNCADQMSPQPLYEQYKDQVIESIGIVAAHSTVTVPWNSVWCLYEGFSPEDKNDENYDSAKLFYNIIKRDCLQYQVEMDDIWNLYLKKRERFEGTYRRLPRAVFQADLNETNIMLNDELEFMGLIDFNLAGTEVILNYIFCECCYRYCCENPALLMSEEFLKKYDDYLLDNIALIKKHYEFTPEEKEAFKLAYNTIVPFSCWQASALLRRSIEENKTEYIPNILAFVKYQLTREDVAL